MKKDIEWLKTEIKKMFQDVVSGEIGLNAEMSLFKVYGLVKELDEPETLNEEWINEHSKSYTMENSVEISDLKNLLLPQPKKPVIPQFVADYIEQSKKDNDSINQVFAFMDDKEDKDLWHWLFPSMYEEKRANQEVFMRAWLDGYEVEKEPHYYVAFEGEFNLLYVTHVDIYGENGKFSYNSVFDKKHALKFTDKSKAEYLADFLGAIVVEVTQ